VSGWHSPWRTGAKGERLGDIDPSDRVNACEICDAAGDAQGSGEAAGGEMQSFGGLFEQSASLLGERHPVRVGLGVQQAIVTHELAGAGGGDTVGHNR